jgi:hypothetical protein
MHSGNIKVLSQIIWEAAILVLLMEEICEVRRWDDLGCNGIHTQFHDDGFMISNNIKVVTATIWEVAVLVLEIFSLLVQKVKLSL